MKKQILISLILLGSTLTMNAQIYTPSGLIQGSSGNNNVGIGTTSPRYYEHGGTNNCLEIYNPGTSINSQSHIILSTGVTSIAESSIGSISWIQPNVSTAYKGIGLINMVSDSNNPSAPAGKMIFCTRSTTDAYWNEKMRIASNGNVGIGYMTGAEITNNKLAVNGSAIFGTSTIDSHGPAIIAMRYVGTGISFKNTKTDHPDIRNYSITTDNYHYGDFAIKQGSVIGGNPDLTRFYISSNGNIGIGITSPQHKLDVLGTIWAREIKVDLNGADFVFEKDYQLMPLNELEQFVKEQKHLPEIASAKEMEENGTDLGNLNSKLLQKVEELTLYVIEQNKKIQALEEKIETASKQM